MCHLVLLAAVWIAYGALHSWLAGNAMKAVYDDPPPADNNIEIDLVTGDVSL